MLNEEPLEIEELLRCNKLSMNVLNTPYTIFATKNNPSHDVDIYVNSVRIERGYLTKCLGVHIDSQLNWESHIEYTCKTISKCI